MSMKVYAPTVQQGERATISCRLDGFGGVETLWFSVLPQYKTALLTERADAFLLGVLLAAMKMGGTLEIAAPVSEQLYHNITTNLIPILRHMLPGLQELHIEPRRLDNRRIDARRASLWAFPAVSTASPF